MKWLAIILSAIILSLNGVPCSDKEDNHAHGLTVITDNHTNHDSPDHEEHCSPFCICDCCSTNFVIQEIPSFYRNQIGEIFAASQKPYSDLYSNLFEHNLLQPPRVA